MFNRFNSSKCKTQCKLCSGRIKLMRNKRNITLAQLRREVAELLRSNKQEHARIRVEAVLREANLLKAYDVLELFTEMLAVRVQMIEKSKDTPPDMLEALSSIVYASQRVQDFPELAAIRSLLAQKYGKEFVAEAADDSNCRKWQVNENLRSCLAVEAPSPELKLQTLSDIAQEHNVEWDAHSAAIDMLPYHHPTTAPGYFNSGGPQQGNNRQAMPWDQQQQGPGPQEWNGQQQTQDIYTQAANAPPPTSLPGARGANNNNNSNNRRGGPGSGPGNAPVSLDPQGDRFSGQHPDGPPPGMLAGNQLPPDANNMSLEEYADAMAAAAAAKMYSGRAQAAADAAARHAASPQRSSRANSDSLGAPAPVTPPPKASPQSPPTSQQPPSQPPAFPPGPDFPGSAPPPSNSGPGGGSSPAHYRTPTDEEIQRRYDAAPGPPAKGGGLPSAPPRPPSPGLPPRAPSPGRPNLDRASPSSTAGPAPPNGAAPAKPKPTEDLDELTRRFEALKRG